MSNLQKTSKVLVTARERLSGYGEIKPAVTVGDGITLKTFTAEVDGLTRKLDTYNALRTAAAAGRLDLKQAEAHTRDFLDRALTGVASKFGKNSIEYQNAGGTKKSERKKPGEAKKQKAARTELVLAKKAMKEAQKATAPAKTPSNGQPNGSANGQPTATANLTGNGVQHP